MENYILPDWPAPVQVKAFTTTRLNEFNLALNPPQEPVWLAQTHSTTVINLDYFQHDSEKDRPHADASYTHKPGIVCCVRTADCLPLLVCNKKADFVMAIHAGWRGLANGIIENALRQINLPPQDFLVWLGPAIGAAVYEVGNEVRELFIQQDASHASGFKPSHRAGYWMMDIYHLARLRCQQMGISHIYGGQYCTFQDTERFYSYRRDKATERMASVIWLDF